MPASKPQPRWVNVLRSSCPRGWTISESRNRIRLQVRSKGVQQSVTLPLDWAPENLQPAAAMLIDLQRHVSGGLGLADALRHVQVASTAQTASGVAWGELMDEFRIDLTLHGSRIKDTTWKSAYEPFLKRAVTLLLGRSAPRNARELVGAVVTDWADRARSRELCVQALDRWLRFCVHDHGLPAGSWTLSERDSKRFRGRRAEKRTKAVLADLEILQLIDATTHTGWRNALMLLALYGLRPEELNHLQAREHPSTGELMLFCSYRKTCGQHRGEARWLLPCPLLDAHGEPVTWQLPGLMKAGLLELPPLGSKYALQTFLRRQPLWQHLSQQAAGRGEWLRPYVFRDSYSLRCHRLGIESGAVAAAMGHSLAVHSSSYRWADEAQTVAAFNLATGEKVEYRLGHTA